MSIGFFPLRLLSSRIRAALYILYRSIAPEALRSSHRFRILQVLAWGAVIGCLQALSTSIVRGLESLQTFDLILILSLSNRTQTIGTLLFPSWRSRRQGMKETLLYQW